MYIVTGGAGFIGSAFVAKLNAKGIEDILVVDELGESTKWGNLKGLKFNDYIHKDSLLELVLADALPGKIEALIHMGACSSTTEKNVDYLLENNYRYSRAMAEYALDKDARFIYASSAATFGAGELGYSDAHDLIPQLKPLNPYGYSKQIFDLWAFQNGLLDKCVGLKFFNVFGPNEYHKAEMRSVVHKAWGQIKDSGRVKLFKSYRADYKDGEQKRDFVYIKDCLEVMWWFLENPKVNGIFNLGSGQARSWNDLVNAAFAALGKPSSIDYIDMPLEIRDQYQYYTKAEMQKLYNSGCPVKFNSLESCIKDYLVNYLEAGQKFLDKL